MSASRRPDDAVRIPTGLREWARSPAQKSWLDSLPDAVAQYSARWHLSLGSPFEPGGTSSWVAPARTTAGDDVVLKVAWRHEESRDEAIGLSLLDGRGAVRVFSHEVTGDTMAMVLEPCQPGTPLRAEPPATQHRAIASILAEVRATPVPTGNGLRQLAEMCDAWAGAAADRYRYTGVVTDPGLVAAGLEMFRELPRNATAETLLLTDLHAGNVLAGTRRPWLAIDPKPYVGDPNYDVIQHLLNRAELVDRPVELVNEVAAAADLDSSRVREWLFARCVVEGAEWPHLLDVARAVAP